MYTHTSHGPWKSPKLVYYIVQKYIITTTLKTTHII